MMLIKLKFKFKYIASIFVCIFWMSCAAPPSAKTPLEKKEGELYKIGKGDILEVITWKEADFSREVPVRIDGQISFPLIDDIAAEGRSTADIRDEIREKLKDYVKHPTVSVAVKSTGSQKFYIIGEVQKPGEYPLLKRLSVIQAFALAGGFTEWAAKKEIVLIRRKNNEDKVIKINYKNIVKGEELDKNVPLKADDIIVVP